MVRQIDLKIRSWADVFWVRKWSSWADVFWVRKWSDH